MARPPWCLASGLILPLLKLHRQPPRFLRAARRLHLLLHRDVQLPTASLLELRSFAAALDRLGRNRQRRPLAGTSSHPSTQAAGHPGPWTGLWILLLPYLRLASSLANKTTEIFFPSAFLSRYSSQTKRSCDGNLSASHGRAHFRNCKAHSPVTSRIAAAALKGAEAARHKLPPYAADCLWATRVLVLRLFCCHCGKIPRPSSCRVRSALSYEPLRVAAFAS